jgi:hypothetical protein
MGFNKDLFLTQNRKNVEENPFGEIDNGYYICDLVDAQLCYSKSNNRYQALFQWKIDPNSNDRFKGQNVFVAIGLEDKDGNPSEQGYKILDIVLSTLGVNDRGSFAEDFENNMPKLVGSRARIEVKEKDGFKQNKINKLLVNRWKEVRNGSPGPNVSPQNPNTNTTVQSNAPSYDFKPFTNTNGVLIDKGAKVTARLKDGQYLGEILSVDPTGKPQALIQFENPNVDTQLVNFDDLFVHSPQQNQQAAPTSISAPQELEELSAPTQPKLEIGMNVKGICQHTHPDYNGKEFTGVIYEFDDANGIVKINSGGKGIPCRRDSIQVI